MSRREQREEIFKLLFSVSFHDKNEFEHQLELFCRAGKDELSMDDMDYIVNKVRSIVDRLSDIDELISANTKGWRIDRLSKVVLSILRLGIYEILFDDTVPQKVAINEAVEISKRYADDEAFGFVNALLGRVVNEQE